ncbi:MAG TPA: universal stress protein [Vitreimonas sp.]|nr:universal stress protein [Vitreimonas sp.]
MMVLSNREDEAVVSAAQLLEKQHDALISALLFTKAMPAESPTGVVYAGIWTVSAPLSDRPKQRDDAARLLQRFSGFARRPSIKRIEVTDGAAADHPGIDARRASMTVMLRPAGAHDETLRRSMFESVLYESGRPVMLVPRGWRAAGIGSTVLVAWDGSREATRAAADAAFLFAKAERVIFLTVENGSHYGPSARDLVESLRRTGVQSYLRSVSDPRQSVDYLLLREAVAMGADLIVMGGYGHARVHEMIFGGVTRSMVRSSPIPLFISR